MKTTKVSSLALAAAEAAAIRVEFGPIVQRDPRELKPSSNNPRKHSKKQIVKLSASIRRFGFTQPVLVTDAGEIVCGHARVEAAKELGLATIPTLCLADLSPDAVRQYRIADNALGDLSDWDMSLLTDELRAIVEIDGIECVEAMGFDIPVVEIMLDGPAEAGVKADPADEIPASPCVPVTVPSDLWVLGHHRLLCGSSLEAENWCRLMELNQARTAFVDPPYNVPVAGHVSGLGKVKHDEFAMASGEMSEGQFIGFSVDWFNAMLPHLVDGAVIAACMDWRHLFELLTAGRQATLSLLNMCVWNKSNGGMGSLYRSKHELICIFKKGQAPHINNVQLGSHGRYRTNVWDFAGANSFGASRMDDLESHPTVKPVAMVAEYIRDVSYKGDIVLDAFMGSGTTILAAERTGRRGFGIEIEPKYVDVAIQRWEKLTGRQAVLASTGQTFAEVAIARSAPIADAA
jgi:DNA modification methylase